MRKYMTDPIGLPFDDDPRDVGAGESPYGKYSTGILPSHVLRRLIRARREVLATEDITDGQIQPASIDLRLGAMAYRIRASFLPGRDARVADKLSDMAIHEIDLKGGAVLETGCVYLVPLLERLELSFRVSGVANPKSSTGRLDVFTRLIADHAQAFDRVGDGYHGPLYAEISPRTFPILVRRGSRLNQLRLRHGSPQFTDNQLKRLHDDVGLGGGAAAMPASSTSTHAAHMIHSIFGIPSMRANRTASCSIRTSSISWPRARRYR